MAAYGFKLGVIKLGGRFPSARTMRRHEKSTPARAFKSSVSKVVAGQRRLIGSVAYGSGLDLTDDLGNRYNFTDKKGEIAGAAVLLPPGAPRLWEDPEQAVAAVEKFERGRKGVRHDATIARSQIVTLPRELTADQNFDVVVRFYRDRYAADGHMVFVAVHAAVAEDGLPQPHAHIDIVERPMTISGTFSDTKGERFAGERLQDLLALREGLAAALNAEMASRGIDARVDHRRNDVRHAELVAQGLELEAERFSLPPEPKLLPGDKRMIAKGVPVQQSVREREAAQETIRRRRQSINKKIMREKAAVAAAAAARAADLEAEETSRRRILAEKHAAYVEQRKRRKREAHDDLPGLVGTRTAILPRLPFVDMSDFGAEGCYFDRLTKRLAVIETEDRITIVRGMSEEETQRANYVALTLAQRKWPDGFHLTGDPAVLSDERKRTLEMAAMMNVNLSTPNRLDREHFERTRARLAEPADEPREAITAPAKPISSAVIGGDDILAAAAAMRADPVHAKGIAFDLLKRRKPTDGGSIIYAGPDPASDKTARLVLELAAKHRFPMVVPPQYSETWSEIQRRSHSTPQVIAPRLRDRDNGIG